ncbi:MAG: hypothetical protein H6R26_1335, partial [Proteobacteria bacterium]|nr:hypothetical protein [Pseudomonadota bacterium]
MPDGEYGSRALVAVWSGDGAQRPDGRRTMPQSKGMHRFRSTGLNALAGLALMLCLLPVRAADVRNLSVTHVDGEFIVAAELVLQTSKEGVFRILADYGQWHRLNHSIISSRIVSVDDGHHFVQSLTRACLLFFCRNISQTQDVTEVDDRELIAVTLPEPGSLRRGLVRWRLEQERDHARVLLF